MEHDPRERALAENEARFRAVNERIEELSLESGAGDGTIEFVCECGNPECAEPLRLTVGEYEWLRRDPARFGVVPGHENGVEGEVVRDEGGFRAVEKTGVAGAVARETDPR
jgi:hypothetical protein